MILRIFVTLVCWFSLAFNVCAVDISNPRALMFAADRHENLIDVIALSSGDVLYRIETSIHPDHIVVSPFAPILAYVEEGSKKITFYDLDKKEERKTLDLPFVPRHVVLDTTGTKIGISDDQNGGFALVAPFDERLEFVLDDFPPSPDVLFDPNGVDIYYSNPHNGSVGVLNTNTQERYEIKVVDQTNQQLTAPSRSLDGRYIYVGNITTGEVYGLNAYSGAIFKTFDIGGTLARPYTTPEGVFLYVMDKESGELVTIQQQDFSQHAKVELGAGIDLVTVGRFDRLNLFLSTEHNRWYIYDNIARAVIKEGVFTGLPTDAFGSADGKFAYIAIADMPMIAKINLEKNTLEYMSATDSGAGAFTVGLSNNVCH